MPEPLMPEPLMPDPLMLDSPMPEEMSAPSAFRESAMSPTVVNGRAAAEPARATMAVASTALIFAS